MRRCLQQLRRCKRAMSPAVSSVIMIAAVMVLVFAALSYATAILNSRLAENEFAACTQFMRATGLQIDSVAWTFGRTQTVSYSSRYGAVAVLPQSLEYSVQVHGPAGWETVIPNVTSAVVMYNMPVTAYSLGNNYFERIMPGNGAFLQDGPSAVVSGVFVREIVPLNSESYLRTVAVPLIRDYNTSITSPDGSSTLYWKFFLPSLSRSNTNPFLSQSITVVGGQITKIVRTNIDTVKISVSFPSDSLGLNSNFFNFDSLTESKSLPSGSVVEFYLGDVSVSIGLV
jgi:hypothetical protein